MLSPDFPKAKETNVKPTGDAAKMNQHLLAFGFLAPAWLAAN